MRPDCHRLVAAALISLGLAAAAQGTSADRDLYVTNDPARSCMVVEPGAGETPSRCYVVECDAFGNRCACPNELPNGWKQPLTAEQCRQLGVSLRSEERRVG